MTDEEEKAMKVNRESKGTCNTPANAVQSECKEVAPAVESLKIKMHAGPEGLAIEFSVPVKMVIFNKQEALKLGELIIENALKL